MKLRYWSYSKWNSATARILVVPVPNLKKEGGHFCFNTASLFMLGINIYTRMYAAGFYIVMM